MSLSYFWCTKRGPDSFNRSMWYDARVRMPHKSIPTDKLWNCVNHEGICFFFIDQKRKRKLNVPNWRAGQIRLVWNKIVIGFWWLSFNRCATITNINFDYGDWNFSSPFTCNVGSLIVRDLFSPFFCHPWFAIESQVHVITNVVLVLILTYSRILTILYPHKHFDYRLNIFYSFGAFLCLFVADRRNRSRFARLHSLLEIFLLNYPKVSVENEIYWILFDWSNSNSLQNISININGYSLFSENVI